MAKAGLIEEMMNDAIDSALDNESIEEETEEEIEKVRQLPMLLFWLKVCSCAMPSSCHQSCISITARDPALHRKACRRLARTTQVRCKSGGKRGRSGSSGARLHTRLTV
jgi:hypothetical protein